MTVSGPEGSSPRLSHVASNLRLYADMLETIADADTVVELLAQVLEYEHALGHVAECAEGGCPDCVKVARSALDRDNRQDFTESARDQFTEDKPAQPVPGAEFVQGLDFSTSYYAAMGTLPCDYPDCPSLGARPFEASRRQDGVTLQAEVRGCPQHARWASRRAKTELAR